MFQVSFERGEGDALIGGPPSPEQDSNENVVSVFVCKVVDPDNPFGTSVSHMHLLMTFKSMSAFPEILFKTSSHGSESRCFPWPMR